MPKGNAAQTAPATLNRLHDEARTGSYLCGGVALVRLFSLFPSSNPKLPVERPVLDGFGNVVGLDGGGTSEVGNGARHL
ncbi:hypothetical protein SCARR_04970 [Pontiella sulfatireligans]|uniref:Uncharacterized protein n=1 Tax=Pontiella sulfatireligans TaxID=2750658 RepID=A0A6C2USD9_9BACT|nr:hypothetical protein SCARR_04970 [Pontiella sulfatireligans]